MKNITSMEAAIVAGGDMGDDSICTSCMDVILDSSDVSDVIDASDIICTLDATIPGLVMVDPMAIVADAS